MDQLSLQGKIYVICQVLYFVIICGGIWAVLKKLDRIIEEIKKRGP